MKRIPFFTGVGNLTFIASGENIPTLTHRMKTLAHRCIRRCLFALVASALVSVFELGAATPLQIAQQAYLKASNPGQNHNFGYSVAVSSNTVVVGAPREGNDESGAAYVFVRNGTTWSEQARLKITNSAFVSRFGWSVAVSGDTIIVGAPSEFSSANGVNGNPNACCASGSGAAYVFVRSGTNWTQQAFLKASNRGDNDQFGWSVAASGDTVVIGAYGEDSNTTGVNSNQVNNSASDSGAAYVFVRSGTNWTQQAYLKASDTASSDKFGTSVALSGETLVIGAPEETSSFAGVQNTALRTTEQTNNSATSSGAAYVFTRSGTNWTQQAYLKAFNTGSGDQFGISVAVSDNTIAVGAWNEDSAGGINSDGNSNNATNSGAAYVFVRNGATWSQQAFLKASNLDTNDAFGDSFGSSVSVSGDTVVAGASREDSNATGVNGNGSNNSAPSAGAAYLFVRSGTNWNQQAYLKASNPDTFDLFGWSVAVSGNTTVIGAYQESSTAPESGAAYVFVEGPVPRYISTPAGPGTEIYFSDVEAGSGDCETKILFIGNSDQGTADLVIESIGFEMPGHITFAVQTSDGRAVSFPHTIPPGSVSEMLQVSFRWCSASDIREKLRVVSNDPARPLAQYTFVGDADDPHTVTLEEAFLRAFIATFTPRSLDGTATLVLETNEVHTLAAEIPAFLGGGTVQLSNFTGSVTVSLQPILNDTTRALIQVESGSFTAPSIRLPSGLDTGLNQLTFGPPEQSGGILFLTNGNYTAYATATIINNLIPAGVTVRGNYSGTYDKKAGKVSLQSRSRDFFQRSDQVLFSYSTNGFWLTWANTNALEEATNILGPWRPVTNAASPYAVITTNHQQQFFRLQLPSP